MWITLSRLTRDGSRPLHANEGSTRERALRMYTTNNAFFAFEEDKKGSLETRKFADFGILDRDILTCPLKELCLARTLHTCFGGKLVYQADAE